MSHFQYLNISAFLLIIREYVIKILFPALFLLSSLFNSLRELRRHTLRLTRLQPMFPALKCSPRLNYEYPLFLEFRLFRLEILVRLLINCIC